MPPDFTRFHSKAGELTEMAWEFYGDRLADVLPALGTHKATLDPRSFTIATFALCGFANLGSIGMQIGGIVALVPERRNELARLGVRAMLAGTMANLISASIAGMFLG